MVNSHNNVISGIMNTLILYTGTAESRNIFRGDASLPLYLAYMYLTVHMLNSPISTAAGQLA